MYNELRSKDVVCRKTHQCVWCAEPINKGDRARYRAYLSEGDFMDDWMHPECASAMADFGSECGEDFTFDPGDFARGSSIPRWEEP
jgi:hypothetical protein